MKCEHEMDEATMKFVEGKGLIGLVTTALEGEKRT